MKNPRAAPVPTQSDVLRVISDHSNHGEDAAHAKKTSRESPAVLIQSLTPFEASWIVLSKDRAEVDQFIGWK